MRPRTEMREPRNVLRRSLPRRGLAALAPCRLLLRGRPSLLGVASRTGLLATAARSPRGVGDPRRSLLGQTLVLIGSDLMDEDVVIAGDLIRSDRLQIPGGVGSTHDDLLQLIPRDHLGRLLKMSG